MKFYHSCKHKFPIHHDSACFHKILVPARLNSFSEFNFQVKILLLFKNFTYRLNRIYYALILFLFLNIFPFSDLFDLLFFEKLACNSQLYEFSLRQFV